MSLVWFIVFNLFNRGIDGAIIAYDSEEKTNSNFHKFSDDIGQSPISNVGKKKNQIWTVHINHHNIHKSLKCQNLESRNSKHYTTHNTKWLGATNKDDIKKSKKCRISTSSITVYVITAAGDIEEGHSFLIVHGTMDYHIELPSH